MSENRLPCCLNCRGPVHGGPCTHKTQTAPACQACLYRAAQPNGLCDICERREQIDTLLTVGSSPDLLRYAATDIRAGHSSDDGWIHAVADWLEGLANRWSGDATGSEMDAAELVARAYFKGWVKW